MVADFFSFQNKAVSQEVLFFIYFFLSKNE